MPGDDPKQFALLKGKPLILHSIEAFRKFDPGLQLIVVMKEDLLSRWKGIVHNHNLNAIVSVPGGQTRFHSVREGLKVLLKNTNLVAVHDAARPLVTHKIIEIAFENAETHGAAIPVVPIPESLREKNGNDSRPVDRTRFMLVQTPQCFQCELLKQAYLHDYHPHFTDDASVVEFAGTPVKLCDGDPINFKITFPGDLQRAEFLMK